MQVDRKDDGSSSAGTSIPEDFNPSSGNSSTDYMDDEYDEDADASGEDDPDYA